MLSHIVNLVSDYETDFGARPNLVYMNETHYGYLREEMPGIRDHHDLVVKVSDQFLSKVDVGPVLPLLNTVDCRLEATFSNEFVDNRRGAVKRVLDIPLEAGVRGHAPRNPRPRTLRVRRPDTGSRGWRWPQ